MTTRTTTCRLVACACVLGFFSPLAAAHKPSDGYVSLTVLRDNISGRWDIALRDLDFVLGLDANANDRLTWGEIRTRLPEIEDYALQRLALDAAGARCPLGVRDRLIDTHTDGAYLVLDLAGVCPQRSGAVAVSYEFLLEVDSTHRGLLNLEIDGTTLSAVLTPSRTPQVFAADGERAWRALTAYFADGVHHIWTGYDHLLFLCSLLLPSVALRRNGRWAPASHWIPVARDVLRTVTAFTAAHSLTLLLAAWGLVTLPSRAVESVIALTVVLAALNNVFPLVDARRWMVALGFGLIHGFGFASVLAGLDLPSAAERGIALLGFNLGVEAGQIAIVAALLPALYALRGTVFYRRAVLVGGSCVVAVVATAWLVERALDLRLVPA